MNPPHALSRQDGPCPLWQMGKLGSEEIFPKVAQLFTAGVVLRLWPPVTGSILPLWGERGGDAGSVSEC